jgi:hypothetical protein
MSDINNENHEDFHRVQQAAVKWKIRSVEDQLIYDYFEPEPLDLPKIIQITKRAYTFENLSAVSIGICEAEIFSGDKVLNPKFEIQAIDTREEMDKRDLGHAYCTPVWLGKYAQKIFAAISSFKDPKRCLEAMTESTEAEFCEDNMPDAYSYWSEHLKWVNDHPKLQKNYRIQYYRSMQA